MAATYKFRTRSCRMPFLRYGGRQSTIIFNNLLRRLALVLMHLIVLNFTVACLRYEGENPNSKHDGNSNFWQIWEQTVGHKAWMESLQLLHNLNGAMAADCKSHMIDYTPSDAHLGSSSDVDD